MQFVWGHLHLHQKYLQGFQPSQLLHFPNLFPVNPGYHSNLNFLWSGKDAFDSLSTHSVYFRIYNPSLLPSFIVLAVIRVADYVHRAALC